MTHRRNHSRFGGYREVVGPDGVTYRVRSRTLSASARLWNANWGGPPPLPVEWDGSLYVLTDDGAVLRRNEDGTWTLP